MAVNHSFIPILGKRIRVTRLSEFGAIDREGDDAQIVTDGFITVSLTAEVEEGTEIIQRNASGALCVNEKFSDSFKRFTVEIEFCGVNPQLLTMVTNAEPYEDYAGEIAGFTIGEGEITDAFALELWTGLSGIEPEEGAEPGGYFLLPFVGGGTFGDIEIGGEDAITFTLTGAMTKGGNQWNVGPYDVLLNEEGEPSPLPTAIDALDHLLLMDTALAPPPVADAASSIESAVAGP